MINLDAVIVDDVYDALVARMPLARFRDRSLLGAYAEVIGDALSISVRNNTVIANDQNIYVSLDENYINAEALRGFMAAEITYKGRTFRFACVSHHALVYDDDGQSYLTITYTSET